MAKIHHFTGFLSILHEIHECMNLSDYIVNDFQPFHSNELLSELKEKSKYQSFSHFPVTEKNGVLLGCIAESDLATLQIAGQTIMEHQYLVTHFCASEENNWLEILPLFAENETNILPVVNRHQKYVGYLDFADYLNFFANTPFLKEEGTYLILEKETLQFSFSEMAQIIEADNGKILGSFVSKKNQEKTQISLKIFSENINDIIQSFRRYEYHIVSNHSDDTYLEDLKNRSDYLQKYLNV